MAKGVHRRRSGKKSLGYTARGNSNRSDKLLGAAPAKPRRARSSRSSAASAEPRGITNEQAAELAKVQRALGEAYTGNGMTEVQAKRAIDGAWTRLDRRRESQAPESQAPKPRGISNLQAAELAELQRTLGEPYTGRGMTAAEAARAIASARARLG